MKRAFAVLVVVALLGAALGALAGCSRPSKADVDRERCFANETLISAGMRLFQADTGMQAPLKDVVAKLHAECPSGGTYSYDATSGVVTCSIHGHP